MWKGQKHRTEATFLKSSPVYITWNSNRIVAQLLGEIPRSHSSSSRACWGKYLLQLKYTVSMPEKESRFSWTGAAWNRSVMIAFLLSAPASTRWLGWRKTDEGTAYWVGFCDMVQSYFDTLLRYVLSVTFCGATLLKVMDQKTLVKRRWGYKERITVYT